MVFLIRLRQAGELLLVIVAELLILLGIAGVIASSTASKAEGVTLEGSICLLILGVLVLVGLNLIPKRKTGRTLSGVYLPFLQRREHASWWLFDEGTTKAVVCVRHWRSEHFKGTSPRYIFSLEEEPMTEEVRVSLADSEQWVRYVKAGTLVKLADGPRYRRHKRG